MTHDKLADALALHAGIYIAVGMVAAALLAALVLAVFSIARWKLSDAIPAVLLAALFYWTASQFADLGRELARQIGGLL